MRILTKVPAAFYIALLSANAPTFTLLAVTNHGGDIYAMASEDNGAVFNVILPEKQIT